MRRKPQTYNAPAVFAEGVVFNKADIPPGYVALGELYEQDHRLHAFVLRACHEDKLRRFRFKRTPKDVQAPIYVNADDLKQATDAYRAGLDEHHAEQRDEPSSNSDGVTEDQLRKLEVGALCGINSSMSELLDIAARLAKACEGMASAWGHKQLASGADEQQPDVSGGGFSVFDN
jgi:hypothetical protein